MLGVLLEQVKRTDLVEHICVKLGRIHFGNLNLEVGKDLFVRELRLLQLLKEVSSKLGLVVGHLEKVGVVLDVADVPEPHRHKVHDLQHFFISSAAYLGQKLARQLVLDHVAPFCECLGSLLSIALRVAEPFSEVHLVKELQSVEVELSAAL